MQTNVFTPLAVLPFAVALLGCGTPAREFHVSVRGDDANDGSSRKPLRTISAAAVLAQPGDVITVHEGIYRERVAPPRGGESDSKRIVYQSAIGEKAEIRGSEVVTGWGRVRNDLWSVVLPNSFFGAFNPYRDTIAGDWFDPMHRRHHTGAVYVNGDWLDEAATYHDVENPPGARASWFAVVDDTNTTLWARFPGIDPNNGAVEINVRKTVFTPERTGVNYITVRGFTMRHAATNWAPPTAEQIGLIGPHWSKGWIIENNVISHSRCSGVSLGKYGDEYDNTSANSAEGYVKTIERGLAAGWSMDSVGSHIVRNNVITDCEQTGIVGSLGAVRSTIEGNHITRIWTRRLFKGAEIGGIKLHAAVDVIIRKNRIHHACRGIWLDWMAQGTRVSSNLLYDHVAEDLFVEVNHGPFLIDNNIFLSDVSIADASEGGAYVHNLFAGAINAWPDLGRQTPYHPAHSTAMAGLANVQGGDNRFFNNIISPPTSVGPPEKLGLAPYDTREFTLLTGGNVYYNQAKPYAGETAPVVVTDVNPGLDIDEKEDGVYLRMNFGEKLAGVATEMVTTGRLGKTRIAGLPYENRDGTPLTIDTDYFGKARNARSPGTGPFADPEVFTRQVKVW